MVRAGQIINVWDWDDETSDNDSLKQSSSTPAPSEEQPTNVLDNESCHKSSGESLEESSSKPAPSEEQPTNVSENDSCNNNSEDSLQHNTSIPEPSQKEHTKSPYVVRASSMADLLQKQKAKTADVKTPNVETPMSNI
ncbi:Protein of unknown function [Pyronema omphalodes CBS 100304]|uniref:Uncharacterized protein n=1 Tax=Pyronema omphalodes (strain CBS 100304) TaxID=1076935 RepID=U4LER1_PYROM|nr:Protein of unknown function [Pyronema omphalodes CBS 100304]